MNKFEELKCEIVKSATSPEKLGEVLTKFGITPDNPETIKEIIKDAGIKDDVDKESAVQMVKNLTQNFSPEMKKYLANLVTEVSKTIPAGPMPDDIQALINSWQEEGGGHFEK